MSLPLVTLQTPQICVHNKGGVNLCNYLVEDVFTLWCDSPRSLDVPVLPTAPGRYSRDLRAPILCTLGICVQDQTPQALGVSAQLLLLTEMHPWDFQGMSL